MNNSCNLTNNMCTIEEKYYKYKNLENPFTIPEIPKNAAKERRTRIINKINKERMSLQSKSVDNVICKNKLRQKRNSYLENQVDELKNTILKLETQNEIYQQLTQSNEIFNFNKKNKSKEDDKTSLDINTNKFKVDNKNISTNTQNLRLPTTEEIITNQNEVQYLAKDDYSEMNFSSTTKSLAPLTEKIDLFDEVKIENSKNDIQIKDDTKKEIKFSSQVQSGTSLLHLTKTEHCCYSQKFSWYKQIPQVI